MNATDPLDSAWTSRDGKSHVLIMWADNDHITIDIWDCTIKEWNPDSEAPVGKVTYSGLFKLVKQATGPLSEEEAK